MASANYLVLRDGRNYLALPSPYSENPPDLGDAQSAALKFGNREAQRLEDTTTKLVDDTQMLYPCPTNLKAPLVLYGIRSAASIYLSHNPISHGGAIALSRQLPRAVTLERFYMQSGAIKSAGVSALFTSLRQHPTLDVLDMSQAYQTVDFGQAFNYVEDDCVPDIRSFLDKAPSDELFSLGHTSVIPAGTRAVSKAASRHPGLVYFELHSAVPDRSVPAPRFIQAQDGFTEQAAWSAVGKLDQQILYDAHGSLEANIRVKYGEGTSYREFFEG